jgi:hypothetical protein
MWTVHCFKQGGARPYTVNIVLDVCMMCLVTVSCRIDYQSASGVGDAGHHVHRT